jgi:hypothetical protein
MKSPNLYLDGEDLLIRSAQTTQFVRAPALLHKGGRAADAARYRLRRFELFLYSPARSSWLGTRREAALAWDDPLAGFLELRLLGTMLGKRFLGGNGV